MDHQSRLNRLAQKRIVGVQQQDQRGLPLLKARAMSNMYRSLCAHDVAVGFMMGASSSSAATLRMLSTEELSGLARQGHGDIKTRRLSLEIA